MFRGFSTTFFSCVLFISLRREQWRRSGGCARNISLWGRQWSLVEKVAQSKKGHRYTMSRIIVPYGGISLCWEEESVWSSKSRGGNKCAEDSLRENMQQLLAYVLHLLTQKETKQVCSLFQLHTWSMIRLVEPPISGFILLFLRFYLRKRGSEWAWLWCPIIQEIFLVCISYLDHYWEKSVCITYNFFLSIIAIPLLVLERLIFTLGVKWFPQIILSYC